MTVLTNVTVPYPEHAKGHKVKAHSSQYLEHFNRGIKLSEGKEWLAAKQNFLVALQIDLQDINATFAVAIVDEEMGNPALAISGFKKVLAINPSHAEARGSLGVLYHKTGLTDESITELRTVFAAEPNHPNARYFSQFLAAALKKRAYDAEDGKRLDVAIVAIYEAILVSPTNPNLHSELGRLYAEISIDIFVAQPHHDNPTGFFHAQNFLPEDRVYLSMVLKELEVSDEPAYLERIGVELCNPENILKKAIYECEVAMSLAPESTRHQKLCAYAHYRKGVYFQNCENFGAALHHYKEAVKLDPQEVALRDNISFVADQLAASERMDARIASETSEQTRENDGDYEDGDYENDDY